MSPRQQENLKNELRYLAGRWPVLAHDGVMATFAWFMAYWFRFNLDTIPEPFYGHAVKFLPLVIVVHLGMFGLFGVPRGAWRFTSVHDLVVIVKAVFFGTAVIAVAIFLATRLEAIPRSVFPLHGVFLVGMLVGTRILYRLYRDREVSRTPGKRVLIVGAGAAGDMLVREMKAAKPRIYQPVGFLDDDTNKKGRDIQGIRVLDNCSKIPSLSKLLRVELVLLAMPSASAEQMRRVVELCDQSDVPYRTLPKVQDILDGTARSQDLRRVSLDDLLGREPVSLDEERIRKRIADKRVLITGGGGSIGSELCRQVARLKPREIVLLEQTEFSLYSIALEITEEFPDVTLHTRLGDVCDEPGVVDVFLAHQPEVVFHAAAYKHVPSLQEQVRETIRNNVLGTEIVSRVARKHACETFALISTDKAVNPASVMGASKRLAEMLIQAQNSLSSTSFITVRFGNVLGSAGSVVPLFEKQIYEGGPVTVTDPQVTRYFMTLSEACQLILQASVLGQGSEIFVLEMGEPVKVDYLARQLIRMSGLIPGRDIDIVYTGLRPGEKLDEELFHYDEKLAETTHDKIRLAESRSVDPEKIKEGIEKLIEASRKADSLAMNEILKHLVPEYKTEQPFDEMQQLA